MLTRAGYTLPAHMMNVRMVRLLDDVEGRGRGRRELMLIYSEDAASIGKTSDDLRADPAGWAREQQALIARATKAFNVARR
jgi:hypothetical protein